MNKGDLVRVHGTIPMGSDPSLRISRGWRDFPGEYHYHSYVWAPDGLLGLVLQKCDVYCLVLLGTDMLWFELNHIKKVSCDIIGHASE